MRNTAFLLALVVSVSGCVLPGNFFGQDVLNVRTSTTTDGVADVLTISDITTIPRSPLLPDREVLLSFVVHNNDLLRTVRQTSIDLFDAPLFKDSKGAVCNSITGSPSSRPCQANTADGNPGRCSISEPCGILPGADEEALFRLITFSQEEIANVKQDTHLNFRVGYNFDSSLTYVFPVVNMDEVIKRQRAGQSTDIVISKTHSSGPVQVDVELLGAPYMLAEFPATLTFTIRNTGSGTIKNSNIEGNTNNFGISRLTAPRTYEELVSSLRNANFDPGQGIVIFFPQEFEILEYPGKDAKKDSQGMYPDGTFECDNNKCWNTGDINIYRDESRVSMRFKIQLKSDQETQMRSQSIPFRSFQIKSLVAYNYELRDSVPITINLFENV